MNIKDQKFSSVNKPETNENILLNYINQRNNYILEYSIIDTPYDKIIKTLISKVRKEKLNKLNLIDP